MKRMHIGCGCSRKLLWALLIVVMLLVETGCRALHTNGTSSSSTSDQQIPTTDETISKDSANEPNNLTEEEALMVLKPNCTVCFLGDSITANGGWIARVAEIYAATYPDNRVRFYNSGVAGTTAGTARNGYLYEECLILNPDYVYICYGINDINSHLYQTKENSSDKIRALQQYRNNLRWLIEEIQAFGATPILLTPPAHDDRASGSYCNVGLKECIAIQKTLAETYKLANFDLFSPFEARLQENITSDGTHPNELGDCIIAEVVLKSMGISVDADTMVKQPLSEANQKRVSLEQKLRLLAFVRWQMGLYDVVNGQYMVPTHMERLKREADQHAAPWSEDVFRSYSAVIYTEQASRAELIKLTVQVAAGM